jgi:indole-3-glycerol phosphate synthase/phosphoribosylanthranilate isomerase
MSDILAKIVKQKRLEIEQLYRTEDLDALRESVRPCTKSFYAKLAAYRTAQHPFFITEFKRKSPSEGWMMRDTPIVPQLKNYLQAGAGAISVLTDHAFFGGSYKDLAAAATVLGETEVLLLQKDFILDPIQIYLARKHGADIILLIAAILRTDEIERLLRLAESLGMGVLLEVHNAEEFQKVASLDFPVLGINNRDLKTFHLALNRTNVLRGESPDRFIVAESGMTDFRDFRMLQHADGFLIGTAFCKPGNSSALSGNDFGLNSLFKATPDAAPLFKACGIRKPVHLELEADFLGVNFSPKTKRKPEADLLLHLENLSATDSRWEKLVAVFYQNSESEILDILDRFPFRRVQLYMGDVPPAFLHTLRKKILLACRLREQSDLDQLIELATDVDCFILDGDRPGSGQRIGIPIPTDFPYPFLLAGGIHAENLDAITGLKNCIGIDVASGIEHQGELDAGRVKDICRKLSDMVQHPTLG